MNFAQLSALVWLRMRLSRNAWGRTQGLGAILAALNVLLGGALALAGGIAGFAGGALALRHAAPLSVGGAGLLLSLSFGMMWLLGVLTELQRSELIDLQKLLHLPAELGQLFVVNYLTTLVGAATAFFVPAAAGLTLGLVSTRGPAFLLFLPLFLACAFALSAWTYWLQGWIAAWIVNPRKRRIVTIGLSLTLVLGFQAPNLLFNVLPALRPTHRSGVSVGDRRQLEKAIALADDLPPLWVAAGAKHLAEGEPRLPILFTLGFGLLGAAGLMGGYRTTLRAYGGASRGSAAPRAVPVRPLPSRSSSGSVAWMERSFLGAPGPVSAVATATLQSMARAPEVAMALGASFLVTGGLSILMMLRLAPRLPAPLHPLLVLGALGLTAFSLTTYLSNVFGFERHGFRLFLLSPMTRRDILLGKNLASGTLGAAMGLPLIVAGTVGLHLAPAAVLAAVAQLGAQLCLITTVGNVASLVAPYRVAAGSMKAQKPSALAALTILLIHALFPLVLAPGALGPLAGYLVTRTGATWGAWLNLALSVTVAGLAALLYARCLPAMGRLMERRELKVLERVTTENDE